jgi:hypothetical protein
MGKIVIATSWKFDTAFEKVVGEVNALFFVTLKL